MNAINKKVWGMNREISRLMKKTHTPRKISSIRMPEQIRLCSFMMSLILFRPFHSFCSSLSPDSMLFL